MLPSAFKIGERWQKLALGNIIGKLSGGFCVALIFIFHALWDALRILHESLQLWAVFGPIWLMPNNPIALIIYSYAGWLFNTLLILEGKI